MTICGRYVRQFAEASHALPDGMHMSADYPFMLPRIVAVDATSVTIEGSRGARETFKITRREGREHGFIAQSSTFERMSNRRPTRFKMLPFKDDRTPLPSASTEADHGT